MGDGDQILPPRLPGYPALARYESTALLKLALATVPAASLESW